MRASWRHPTVDMVKVEEAAGNAIELGPSDA